MNKQNRKRRQKLHERQFGDYADVIRSLPCVARGKSCDGPIHAHHTKSRGAGGDKSSLVPLCAAHHQILHTMGVGSFQHRFMVDLEAVAAENWDEWTGGGEHRDAVTGSFSGGISDG